MPPKYTVQLELLNVRFELATHDPLKHYPGSNMVTSPAVTTLPQKNIYKSFSLVNTITVLGVFLNPKSIKLP